MFVKQHGTGPQHFFGLHGWSGDHRTFDPLVRYVPPAARLYAADLPGCGSSPAPERWNLATVSREIANEVAQRGPVTLVGNCIGALLGMRAAMEKPGSVRRLVLIDAFAHWPWYFRVFTARGWGKYAYRSTFANPMGRRIVNAALATKRSRESDLTEGFAAARHEVALEYLHMLREIDSASEFASLRAPVDLIVGAHSFRAARESVAVWKAMWPWASVWELPGAGHLPLREATAAVSEIVFEGVTCQPPSSNTSNTTAP